MRAKLVVLFAGAALLVLLWPALRGEAILGFRDMLQNYWPMRELFWSGRIGLWNEFAFGGAALPPDIVQQPFYLPNLLMRLLHAPAWPGMPLLLFAHLAFGTVATWSLLRRFGHEEGAALGAAVFALCGFSVANLSNEQWACAAAWVPAVLLAFDRWAERGGAARLAFVALSLPQILLAGDPQLCALTGVAGGCVLLLRRKRPLARLLQEAIAVAALGALIVAPQVVSSVRALHAVERGAGLPMDVREQWSLHPARIAELFVPRMFGPLFSAGFWGGFTVSAPWKRNYVHSLYAGVVGPALIACALSRRRRDAAPWLLIAAGALLLALGPYFFHLYGALGELLPPFRVFRYPQRLAALLMPAWAALLALGAAEIVRLPRGRRVVLAAASALVGGIALAATAFSVPADPAAVSRSALQIALAGAASCLALALPERFAIAALGAVLVVDLAAANGELAGLLPREPFRTRPAACDALDAVSGHAPRDGFRIYVDNQGLEPAGEDWGAQRIREFNYAKRSLAELCGFRETVAINSLEPLDLLQLWREVSPQRMLRVMGTRFVVSSPRHAAAFGGRQMLTDSAFDFTVVELPDSAPLLFRPQRVERIPSPQFLAAARARSDLLGAQVAAIDAPLLPHQPDASASLLGSTGDHGRIVFRVRQDQPGYWVLAELLDRDWRAEIDGSPARIERSDLVRRAVWVPKGEHEVALRYVPTLQLWLFALSALLTLALVAAASRRDQTSTRMPGAAT